MFKVCKNCKLEKHESQFYFNSYWKWTFSVCKECTKTHERKTYQTNRTKRLERVREYYKKNRDNVLARFKRHSPSKRRAAWRRASRRSMENHPERHLARTMAKEAVRKGTLARLACEVCGNFLSQAHHPDYSKPLEVIWLCKRHHYKEHGKIIGSLIPNP